MDFYSRKRTRLEGYDYSTPGAYFLTICTLQKQNLLGKIVGGGDLDAPKVRLSRVGRTAEKYIIAAKSMPGVRVDKFVIMPNHIHIILFVEEILGTSRSPSPTNAVIPRFVGAFKRYCHQKEGKIFQRSYHDHIIRGEVDYQKIWQYIDTNPLRWAEDCFYNEE